MLKFRCLINRTLIIFENEQRRNFTDDQIESIYVKCEWGVSDLLCEFNPCWCAEINSATLKTTWITLILIWLVWAAPITEKNSLLKAGNDTWWYDWRFYLFLKFRRISWISRAQKNKQRMEKNTKRMPLFLFKITVMITYW